MNCAPMVTHWNNLTKASPSAEMQLLLACCRNLSGKLPIEFDTNEINWGHFIKLVSKHRLFPLVNHVIKNNGENIPVNIRDEIAIRASKNQKKMIALAGELKTLNSLFSASGVDFIGIKGPLMVQQFFGDYSSRQSRDLDLLIQVPDIEKAISLLAGAGYQLKDDYFMRNLEKRHLYMKRENHLGFFHPVKRIILELHWSVSKYFTSFKTEDLFAHSIQIEVEGLNFKTLPLEDYFVILASHGVYHRFARLFWLQDLACILSTPGIGIAKMLAKAEKLHCLSATRAGMALAATFFEIKTPEGFPEIHTLHKKEKYLFRQCLATILDNRQLMPDNRSGKIVNTIKQRFSHQKFFFLMTDDWASKRRILLNTLIKPYVWGDKEKLPNNNMVYLLMTQIKWLKMVVTGRMTRTATLRKDK